MFFTVLGACLSAVSVTPILLLAASKWLRRTARTWGGNSGVPDPIDNIIFLNLMFADLIRVVGNLLMVRWMLDGVITERRLCTFQAVIKQIGSTSMAMMSLAIVAHTFCVLVLRWRGSEYISKVVVLTVWGFTALVVEIPYHFHRNERYYGEAGYWCFVRQGPGFVTEQLVTEYLWVWGAAPLIMMAILYFTIFVVMRGWFIVDNDAQDGKSSKTIANSMLYYPAVYISCTLSPSVRWTYFNVPKSHTNSKGRRGGGRRPKKK